MSESTLLVGLDNPHSARPEHALLPVPENATGDRIVRLIREVDPDYTAGRYLLDFRRTNLYPLRRAPSGRGAAELDRLAAECCHACALSHDFSNVVLLGGRVHRAFEHVVPGVVGGQPKLMNVGRRSMIYYPIQHPSGRNRFYNDPEKRAGVARLLNALRSER